MLGSSKDNRFHSLGRDALKASKSAMSRMFGGKKETLSHVTDKEPKQILVSLQSAIDKPDPSGKNSPFKKVLIFISDTDKALSKDLSGDLSNLGGDSKPVNQERLQDLAHQIAAQ